MIDLHTHSKYSDGTWTVEELLIQAEQAGVSLLSIADHDCVDAHIELKNKDISNIFSGKIITGGEFNAMFNKNRIELLGYNFDVDKVASWIKKSNIGDKQKTHLRAEFNMFTEACRNNGVKIDDDLVYTEDMGWPIDVVFASMRRYEENKRLFTDKSWNDIDCLYRCCTCDVDFPLYMDFSNQTPDAKEVSQVIRNAGGKVFLAHLFIYPFKDYEKYLDLLRENNIIDGIEVYYSKFSDKKIKFLEEYCNKYNLLKSAGTDCHGMKRPDRKIGVGYGNMNVSEECVFDWL